MAELEVSGITFAYEETPVLSDVSLKLHEHELVSILGASGCGKTTLFHVIAGLHKPQQGKVILNGRDITGCPGQISYMMQKDLLLPYRTIEDNVILPLLLKGELSGGMRQRAALFRTYMFSREVALLDEPFSALDTLTKSEMHRWYLDVMDKIHMSTLFITHDIDEAILLSDRICLLTGKPGRVTEEIVIKEPRPRKREFNLTEEFLKYKRRILERL